MTTIADVLADLGIPFFRHGEKKSVRAGWLGTACPYCGHGGADAYLGFPLDGRTCSCWSCGSHPLVNTLELLSDRPRREIIKAVFGMDQAPVEDALTAGRYTPPAGLTDRPTTAHLDYLAARGFDAFDLERLWRIGYLGIAGRLSWRIFIPVYYRGRPVSWTTRAIGTDPRRYVAAAPADETISAKHLLLGHDFVRAACVLVEGFFDSARIGPGAVASLGTGVTAAQLTKLAAVPVRAIAFDNEEGAQRRAREWARALAPLPGVTEVVRIESASDWALADPAEVKALRKRYLED